MTHFLANQGYEQHGPPPIELVRDEKRDEWTMILNDGIGNRHAAILPRETVRQLAEVIHVPQPVTQTQVQWGIRWKEDPDTVQGPLDEDYAKRKASPSYGDTVVRRTRTDYRPTFTAWEPVEP